MEANLDSKIDPHVIGSLKTFYIITFLSYFFCKKHIEQKSFSLSSFIERYQEIGPWDLWLACRVDLLYIFLDGNNFFSGKYFVET